MEHSTAPGFENPGEWDRASYEHHPGEDIDGPLDTTTSEYRQASIRFLQLVLQMDEHMTRHRDAYLSWLSISFALGLSSTRGKTLTETAIGLGVTKQALSRYVCRFLRVSGLEPAFGLKSTETRRKYQRTNGHKYVDVDDTDLDADNPDIDPDSNADGDPERDEPRADSVQPLV